MMKRRQKEKLRKLISIKQKNYKHKLYSMKLNKSELKVLSNEA